MSRARSSRARTFGSMSSPRRPSRSRWTVKASAGCTPPRALTLRHAVEQRQRLVGQPRAGLFQPVDRRRKALADGVVEIVQRHALARCRCAGRRAAPARAARSPRPPSPHRPWRNRRPSARSARSSRCCRTAERRRRSEMRCRLGLKPTMPHSAAGMRVEPPVSLPMAISHMPSATATAPPDDRAAGNARAVGRIARRAEMRIDADAGKGEFGHVGLGDDHRAAGAQAPHHRRVGRRPACPPRPAPWSRRASPRRRRRTDP